MTKIKTATGITRPATTSNTTATVSEVGMVGPWQYE